MRAISTRLLVGTGLVLTVFVVLTALAVSWSVHQRAETARFDRLQGLVYGILGATELRGRDELVVNEGELPDRRLVSSSIGLYAEFIGYDGSRLWRSRSSTLMIPETQVTPIGEWLFERVVIDGQGLVDRLQLSTVWVLDSGEELPFIVHVVDEADLLVGQLRKFDQTLWATLLVAAIALLAVQLLVLRVSLKPLARIGQEIAEIENGQRDTLSETVPRELIPLASSVNALLGSERGRHAQYRHLLDDLAHRLKTPLSVLHNLAADCDKEQSETLLSQTTQMQGAIDRYLQRAAVRSPRYLAAPLSPLPALQRLSNSLGRLYQDPERYFSIDIEEDFDIRVDEADLYEILGNVLDNACKYGATRISISSQRETASLIVEDNGPGLPEASLASLTQRGMRADTNVDGEGVGLAATRELMAVYGGTLELSNMEGGGARVALVFS